VFAANLLYLHRSDSHELAWCLNNPDEDEYAQDQERAIFSANSFRDDEQHAVIREDA
jgi:hypothetical protein